jgi:hypothetical protein
MTPAMFPWRAANPFLGWTAGETVKLRKAILIR